MTLVLWSLLTGCTVDPDKNPKKAAEVTETDPGGPAELAALSSGECPDFSASGTSTFTSSGDPRQVTVILPDSPTAGMSVNFFFHGVADPSTENPGGETATGLGLQALANSTHSVWIVPDAPIQNLLGVMEVYLWDLSLESDHDLVLYDDLRTCVAQNLDVDLNHFSASGFSGGALWTTVILANRGDTLATAVELSGGSDITAPGFENLLSQYHPPAADVPVLLTTGAADVDVWPSTSMKVIDFVAASDTLQAELRTDEHFVVRCSDEDGHVMGRKDWETAKSWLAVHTFGEASPYETDGLGSLSDWCAVAE